MPRLFSWGQCLVRVTSPRVHQGKTLSWWTSTACALSALGCTCRHGCRGTWVSQVGAMLAAAWGFCRAQKAWVMLGPGNLSASTPHYQSNHVAGKPPCLLSAVSPVTYLPLCAEVTARIIGPNFSMFLFPLGTNIQSMKTSLTRPGFSGTKLNFAFAQLKPTCLQFAVCE